MIRNVLAPFEFTYNYMVSVAYHLSKPDRTVKISFFFVNPQNSVISDMTLVFIVIILTKTA